MYESLLGFVSYFIFLFYLYFIYIYFIYTLYILYFLFYIIAYLYIVLSISFSPHSDLSTRYMIHASEERTNWQIAVRCNDKCNLILARRRAENRVRVPTAARCSQLTRCTKVYSRVRCTMLFTPACDDRPSSSLVRTFPRPADFLPFGPRVRRVGANDGGEGGEGAQMEGEADGHGAEKRRGGLKEPQRP